MFRQFAVIALIASTTASATVPPPLPPSALEIYRRIAAEPDRASIESYVLLFSLSVRLTVNGAVTGTDRAAFKRFLMNNAGYSIKRRLVSFGNPILIADSVFFPFNGCCLHTRFATYHVGKDNLVDEVTMTDGGTFWDGSLEP